MSKLLLLCLLAKWSSAGYVLQDAYMPNNFFEMFNFFTGQDPTQGYVKFVDQGTARSAGILNSDGSTVKWGVDTKTVAPKDGRMSVRLESKASYNHGLIILDVAHMPGSICGSWPAFWTVGPQWPSNGEIDILEGVNSQRVNAMTLHTGPGCQINPSPQAGMQSGAGALRYSGTMKSNNCDVKAAGQAANQGCSISANDDATYGDGLNAKGGGIYATDWTAESIRMFHFSRDDVPDDIEAGNPDPKNWGQPVAVFHGCDFKTAVNNQTIVFDTTFCGQWAGADNVWKADAVCSKKAATCQEYVANNPADFAEAYWEVNSVKVFQQKDDTSPAPPSKPEPSQLPPPMQPPAPPSQDPKNAPAPSKPNPTYTPAPPAMPPSMPKPPGMPPSMSKPGTSTTPIVPYSGNGPEGPVFGSGPKPTTPPTGPGNAPPQAPLPLPNPNLTTRTTFVTYQATTVLTIDAAGFRQRPHALATMAPGSLKPAPAANQLAPPNDCTGDSQAGCISLGSGKATFEQRKTKLMAKAQAEKQAQKVQANLKTRGLLGRLRMGWVTEETPVDLVS